MTNITRDTWGIAHIDAPDAMAAFRAQGWIAAADRIWQMEWDRLRAAGRWSEVVGSAGVKEDAFFRRLGLADAARRDWESLGDDAKRMTVAYAGGVNAWLDANLDGLPAEFEHHPFTPAEWEPWHCVSVYKVRHIFMGTMYRKLWRGAVVVAAGPEIARVMRGDPDAASAIVPGEGADLDLLADGAAVVDAAAEDLAALATAEGGSNSWAVHGSRTASGLPLLAGDPHRGIEFPNVYHQCHLRSPDFDVIGMAFPGVPGFPHFGHNSGVAWCITHGMADDTDLFVERFGEGHQSMDDIEWTSETLKIRGQPSVEVWRGATDRGPVVIGDPASGAALGMMWTGLWGNDTTFDALWPMLNAVDCDSLEEAVRPWVIPVNNLLTADTAGNISFHIRGRVIERSNASRWTPVPGADAFAWTGIEEVPFEDLQSSRNPDRGFLVTANNRISEKGPYISMDFAGPARHDRIVQLLSDAKDATTVDMLTIHRDVKSLVAPRIIGRWAELGVSGTTAEGIAAFQRVLEWNHEVSNEAVGASIYAVIRRRWAESVGERCGIANAELGAPGWPRPLDGSRMMFEAANELMMSNTWSLVPGIDTEADLLTALNAAVDETAVELAERLGDNMDEWRWERLHRMASPHPLASVVEAARGLHPPVDGCPGDGDTVRCGTLYPETGERAAASSVARYVFDVGDWDASGWIVPHGVSGVRGSGHDLDQRQGWLDGTVVPMVWSPEAIVAHAAETFSI
ncbi:MAG: penicillin amidase [Candidatus Poriferisodalaceae bacterium]|jgi:penicillin amidase